MDWQRQHGVYLERRTKKHLEWEQWAKEAEAHNLKMTDDIFVLDFNHEEDFRNWISRTYLGSNETNKKKLVQQ
jgi:hypothetical protein